MTAGFIEARQRDDDGLRFYQIRCSAITAVEMPNPELNHDLAFTFVQVGGERYFVNMAAAKIMALLGGEGVSQSATVEGEAVSHYERLPAEPAPQAEPTLEEMAEYIYLKDGYPVKIEHYPNAEKYEKWRAASKTYFAWGATPDAAVRALYAFAKEARTPGR